MGVERMSNIVFTPTLPLPLKGGGNLIRTPLEI